MPSHRCHEEIGVLMGINVSALRDANLLIDDPDKWFSERGLQNLYGLRHDDDRVFAMNIVRSILRDIYGDDGILAADLHYALDYIERWLDPELSEWMLRKMRQQMSFNIFLQAFAKKIDERKIDIRVVDFIGTNFSLIVTMIVEDRVRRGLNSINLLSYLQSWLYQKDRTWLH